MEGLQWSEIQPGIWKCVIGNPSELNPLSFMGRSVKAEALQKMGSMPFPLEPTSVECELGAKHTVVRFPLTEKEQIYGMGLQFMRMNHRGKTRYLRVNSDPKQDTGESHAPIPFYVTDRGYGVLVNTSRIVTFHCGSTVRKQERNFDKVFDRNEEKQQWKATPVSEQIEIVLPAEGAELYLFAGNSPLEVVRRYNLLCGGGTLPPRWGLGFWHRVPTLYTADEVLQEALEFRKRDFPCDVIGLEPGWHSKSYPVTNEWSPKRFPNPQAFVQKMADEGFRINLWEHPYLSHQGKLYSELEPLSGSYTVWGGLAPDYALPKAQELYQDQHDQEHLAIGVSGYKLDECDGSELTNNAWMFPAHAQFPSGYDGEQMRQMYGLMFQKMTADLYAKRNRRTYGLVRASNAGASSLPYVLYSDLYDHRQFVRALCNASFSGLLWTPEVRRAASAEDWVRRIQTVCFSPLAMLNAWGDKTKPWTYPEVEGIVRHYIQLRMRLIPYLYSTFARYHFDGTPPFRAMPLEGLGQGAAGRESHLDSSIIVDTIDAAYGSGKDKDWDNQFMVGDALLVAPLFAGEKGRDVFLPEGIWYGLETGERYSGGGVIHVEPGMELIPVFVKEGSVIPMMAAYSHMPKAGEAVDLEMVHFGTLPGSYALYDDDGETFDYSNGDYQWRTVEVFKAEDGSLQGRISDAEAGRNSTFAKVNWRLGVRSL